MTNPYLVTGVSEAIYDTTQSRSTTLRLKSGQTSSHNECTRKDRKMKWRRWRCTHLPGNFRWFIVSFPLLTFVHTVSCQVLQPQITASSTLLPSKGESTLKCQLNTSYTPSTQNFPLSWSHQASGALISTSEQNIGGGVKSYTSTMTFTPTAIDNEASLTCNAEIDSHTGSATYTIQVILVPRKPDINGPDTVNAFENHTWFCLSQGASFIAPNVYWRDGRGAALNDGGNASTFINIVPNNNKMYDVTRNITLPLPAESALYNLTCIVVHEYGSYSTREFSTKTITVYFPPQITKNRGDTVYAYENTWQSLSCIISASSPPAAEVSWTKDGSPIDLNSGRYEAFNTSSPSLAITSVKKSDAGRYTCTVTNPKGSTSFKTPTTLVVQYAPIISYPNNQTEFEGSAGGSLTIPCPVDSVPDPTAIRWKRVVNGVTQTLIIDSNSRYSGGSAANKTYSLTINPLQDDDAGMYFCEVDNAISNGVGPQVTTVVNHNVQVNVSNYYERNEGESVSMSCSFYPTNPVTTVYWTRSEPTQVSGSYSLDDPTLTIMQVVPADVGIYYCVVIANSREFRSSAVNLLVNYAPRVGLLSEITYYKKYGESVILQCPATGYPPPKHTWLRNDAALDVSNTSKYVLSNGGKALTIFYLVPEDEASYRCTVSNRMGNATGQTLEVDIMNNPIVTVPASLQPYEGQNFTISCTVVMTPPPTTVTWMKGGSSINIAGNANKYSGGTLQTPSLTVYNAAKEDSGTYSCQGYNGMDTINGTAAVTVIYAPKVTVESSEIIRDRGVDMTLSCTVDASPPVHDIVWLSRAIGSASSLATRVAIGGRFSGGSPAQPSLIITSLLPQDAATYYCVANNTVNVTISQAVTLRVRYQPSNINVTSLPASLLKGDKFELHCSADAYPNITSYTWYRGEVNVANAAVYLKDQAEVADYTNFRCIVTNLIGTASATIKPDIQFVPEPDGTGNQTVFGLPGTFVTLKCTVLANPAPSSYIWYKGSGIIQGATSFSLTLLLNADRDYDEYSCGAVNSRGTLYPAKGFTVKEGSPTLSGAFSDAAIIILIIIICIILLIIIVLLIIFCYMQGVFAKCGKKKDNTKVAPTPQPVNMRNYNGGVLMEPPLSNGRERGNVSEESHTITPKVILPPVTPGAIISVPEKSGPRAHYLPPLNPELEPAENYYKEEPRSSRKKKKKNKKRKNEDQSALTAAEDGNPSPAAE